jgi:hypothetical protein
MQPYHLLVQLPGFARVRPPPSHTPLKPNQPKCNKKKIKKIKKIFQILIIKQSNLDYRFQLQRLGPPSQSFARTGTASSTPEVTEWTSTRAPSTEVGKENRISALYVG